MLDKPLGFHRSLGVSEKFIFEILALRFIPGQHPFRVRSAGSGVERISDEGTEEVVLGWDMAGARGERQCSRRREECGSSAS